MTLSVRKPPYKIPEYSLTGDLLSFLKCPLQYRLYNRNALPPSKPVQLWFGEFIHGVLEEAYIEWSKGTLKNFPLDWKRDIRAIELRIYKRLQTRGLNPPPPLFCPYDENFKRKGLCKDNHHPHKLIASQRAEAAINTWGPHLFPLIKEHEVKLKGLRKIPHFEEGEYRSNYYGITGVIDVISSLNLEKESSTNNLIIKYLYENEEIKKMINKYKYGKKDFEIIVDYKGMRRPSLTNKDEWEAHEWQILSYAWLRHQQPDAKQVIAGILFYFNELVPTADDLKILSNEIKEKKTDVMPTPKELKNIFRTKNNSTSHQYFQRRSIRIIPITKEKIQKSIDYFDSVVENIEKNIIKEIKGEKISEIWVGKPEKRTCDACDFKTFCKEARDKYNYIPIVP